MNKKFYESKTIQGVILAVLGGIWGIWTGNSELSQTIVIAGLGWAGIGLRVALPTK